MSFAILYWILMLLWLLFGVWGNWPRAGQTNGAGYRPLGGTLLLFILLLILGWRAFGPPVHS